LLDDDNFEQVITTYKNVFVLFHVPFCSHEAQLQSVFQKAYNKFYKKKKSIKFAKMNAYVHKKWTKELGLKGYPAMILFQGNVSSTQVFNKDIKLYDVRSFIDIHVYNRIRRFDTWEQYNRNKLSFEIAFMGNPMQFPNIYSEFVQRSKNTTLYRYVYLP
jgi:thioredoxin-like negative regulator of GroEL